MVPIRDSKYKTCARVNREGEKTRSVVTPDREVWKHTIPNHVYEMPSKLWVHADEGWGWRSQLGIQNEIRGLGRSGRQRALICDPRPGRENQLGDWSNAITSNYVYLRQPKSVLTCYSRLTFAALPSVVPGTAGRHGRLHRCRRRQCRASHRASRRSLWRVLLRR